LSGEARPTNYFPIEGASKNSKFQARQGASKKLRRGIGLVCEEQFFVSDAVLRHNEVAVQADLKVMPQLKSGFLEAP